MTSPEDELVRRLGEAARARAAEEDDALWEQVAMGTLPPQQLADLEKKAASSPEVAERLRVFRPLSPEVKARIAHGVSRTAAPAHAMRAKPPRWWVPTVGLALAATLVTVVMQQASPPPLPEYALTATGDSQLRGGAAPAPDAKVQLTPSSRLQLLLRPAQAVSGELSASVYVVRGQALSRWEASVETSEEGSVRIVAEASRFPGPAEPRSHLVVVMGRKDALPKTPEQAAPWVNGERAPPAGVQLHPLDVEWAAAQ